MKTFTCPGCGAAGEFQSAASVFAVCAFCSAMLIRRDADVEAIGTMAVLQEDGSVLQIGTRGKHAGHPFTLIGRLRQNWADGSWNEWYMRFADGHFGWLGEAQGFYMVSFPRTAPAMLPKRDELKPDVPLALGDAIFQVDDIKPVLCGGGEGELPFRAVVGRPSTSIDLSAPGGRFATLEYSDDEPPKLYLGDYVDFKDLHFLELRPVDGW